MTWTGEEEGMLLVDTGTQVWSGGWTKLPQHSRHGHHTSHFHLFFSNGLHFVSILVSLLQLSGCIV